jgi:glutamine amidotransferase
VIAIIDYGAGNIFSVKNALDYIGEASELTSDPEKQKKAEKLILPGVGAFPDAMKMLGEKGLIKAIKEEAEQGKPLLGICLGMQILFEKGYEFGETEGLGLIEGYVDAIVPPEGTELKIPHMGWNDVKIINEDPVAKSVKEGDMFYFVHSYKAVTNEENIILATSYGEKIPALVKSKTRPTYGAQFHPEKSGEKGIELLRNFIKLC